jgi:hypothetical protein
MIPSGVSYESPPRVEIVVTGNTVVDAVRHIAETEIPAVNAELIACESELSRGGRISPRTPTLRRRKSRRAGVRSDRESTHRPLLSPEIARRKI